MGQIINPRTGEGYDLGFVTTIGRSGVHAIVLKDRKVSATHAEIRWTVEGWRLRDLGSRNGTYVNDAYLSAPQTLKLGDVMRFGSTTEWVFANDETPSAVARSASGHSRVGNPLWLPDEANPQLVVDGNVGGPWELTRVGDESTPVPIDDGAVLEVDGEQWTLALPVPAEPETLRASALVCRLSLQFEVVGNEPLAVCIRWPDGQEVRQEAVFALKLLLVLAERRLVDQSEVEADEAGPVEMRPDVGWTSADLLADWLEINRQRLNVETHRARALMARLKVLDFKSLVESRRVGRQFEYRIGTGFLSVVDRELGA